jgi:hypothetical protein
LILSIAWAGSTPAGCIEVPAGQGELVVTDGHFSPGEWDDALRFDVADNYDLYLMADAEALYVGLKSAKPLGELVCESRFTTNDEDVFLLHVSGALGEAVSGFPATTKFELNNNTHWEANFLQADPEKEAAWIAAGRPLETYDDVYDKRDGIEFKIRRRKFTGSTLKFTIGWVRVEVAGGKIDKRIYSFPVDATLQNSGNWSELVLPPAVNRD